MIARPARRLRTLAAAASVLALTAALLFGVVPSAFAKQSIGLSSASFDFTANPGQDAKGEVFLSNQGDQTVNVLIYAADQVVDKKGRMSFVTPNRDTTNFLDSPASWVQMKLPGNAKTLGNTPYVVLKQGERIPVDFLVQVPTGAVPGDKQIMIFFEITDLDTKSQGVSSRVSGRLGARVKARVAGEYVEQVDVRPFVVPQLVTGDSVPYTFTINNGSNVDKTLNGPIQVLDRSESSRAETQALKDDTVYAGKSLERSGVLAISGLAPGRYTVRLDAKYPRETVGLPDGEIVKTLSFWFVPLWLIITGGVLLLLVLIAVVWWIAAAGGRRRALRQAAEAQASSAAPAAQAPSAEPRTDEDARASGS